MNIDKVIEKERKKLLRGSKRNFERLREEKDEVTQKYIDLLEEVKDNAQRYIKYEDLYIESKETIKELKKEISNLKTENKTLQDRLGDK